MRFENIMNDMTKKLEKKQAEYEKAVMKAVEKKRKEQERERRNGK